MSHHLLFYGAPICFLSNTHLNTHFGAYYKLNPELGPSPSTDSDPHPALAPARAGMFPGIRCEA